MCIKNEYRLHSYELENYSLTLPPDQSADDMANRSKDNNKVTNLDISYSLFK